MRVDVSCKNNFDDGTEMIHKLFYFFSRFLLFLVLDTVLSFYVPQNSNSFIKNFGLSSWTLKSADLKAWNTLEKFWICSGMLLIGNIIQEEPVLKMVSDQRSHRDSV